MSASVVSVYSFSEPRVPLLQGRLSSIKTNSRCMKKWGRVKCCCRRIRSTSTEQNYYELLGISGDSEPQEIKEAYRKLQKKYHPDIAGRKGHEYTLKLNKAYKVLIQESLRREYDASIGQMRMGSGSNNHVNGYSSWRGPVRPQALFVDENACIGCRECVHHASNTFIMDEALGCARVKVQFGDGDQNIEASVDSCPVNCIHRVDSEELAVLEFLIQPKMKEGYGVFGQGWERPNNVFKAAKSFKKQMDKQAEHCRVRPSVEEETPAQAEARVNASMKINMERFPIIWNLLKQIFVSDA